MTTYITCFLRSKRCVKFRNNQPCYVPVANQHHCVASTYWGLFLERSEPELGHAYLSRNCVPLKIRAKQHIYAQAQKTFARILGKQNSDAQNFPYLEHSSIPSILFFLFICNLFMIFQILFRYLITYLYLSFIRFPSKLLILCIQGLSIGIGSLYVYHHGRYITGRVTVLNIQSPNSRHPIVC